MNHLMIPNQKAAAKGKREHHVCMQGKNVSAHELVKAEACPIVGYRIIFSSNLESELLSGPRPTRSRGEFAPPPRG